MTVSVFFYRGDISFTIFTQKACNDTRSVMKDIYYIHTGHWPSASPSIVFVTGTVHGLAQHTTTHLVVQNNDTAPDDDIYNRIMGRKKPGHLIIHRIGKNGRPKGHINLFRTARQIVEDAARDGRVAAIITRSIGFLPYLAGVKRKLNLPCYFETHDFYGDLTLRPDLKRSLLIYKKHWYERRYLKRMNGIICLTGPQADLFRGCYPDVPIVVARTGLLSVTSHEPPRNKVFCYIGSLDPHKGVGTVLDALTETRDPGIRLLVIGGKSRQDIDTFLQLADQRGVGSRIEITGWVAHADVSRHMEHCTAGIIPLNDTPFNRSMTSPLKILDCFSRSLPIVASDLPSVRDYVKDGVHGILFSPGDAKACARALDRMANEADIDAMSRAVNADAKSYLWERRAEKILAFIKETS